MTPRNFTWGFLSTSGIAGASHLLLKASWLTIAFFAISGLDILNGVDELSAVKKKEICDWIYSLQILPNNHEVDITKRCGFQGSNTLTYNENGERSSIPLYSCGHLAMTYTGIGSLVILGDDLSRVDRQACIQGVRALQQDDGSRYNGPIRFQSGSWKNYEKPGSRNYMEG
ncbi:Geranylgeranyl transferase type-1 subunit beta [Homalodisca vitripennis]|nr:Geranylgeranyl transferase type-1 subunit beta [Homalodisca vitripennis]